MQKIFLSVFIVAIVVGGGAFYGGMKYQANKTTKERQQSALGGQQFGGPAGWRGGTPGSETAGKNLSGRAGGANLVGGEIIARDETSVTVKLRDGSSKIIFFSDSTEIMKSVKGAVSDLEIGQTVSVGGKQNSDGSFTAETIQLRTEVAKP